VKKTSSRRGSPTTGLRDGSFRSSSNNSRRNDLSDATASISTSCLQLSTARSQALTAAAVRRGTAVASAVLCRAPTPCLWRRRPAYAWSCSCVQLLRRKARHVRGHGLTMPLRRSSDSTPSSAHSVGDAPGISTEFGCRCVNQRTLGDRKPPISRGGRPPATHPLDSVARGKFGAYQAKLGQEISPQFGRTDHELSVCPQ
jgi:hypothetical protein